MKRFTAVISVFMLLFVLCPVLADSYTDMLDKAAYCQETEKYEQAQALESDSISTQAWQLVCTLDALSVEPDSNESPVRQYHMYLIRLEDKEQREVKGIDPSKVSVGALGCNYPPIIEWNSDTLLININNTAEAYRFG